MDREDDFVRHCQDAYQYMASLMRRADEGEQLQSQELLSQLSSVVEELTVAGEELSQQASELTATRDELASERQHYQELFELAPDGYFVTDKEGRITECNLAGISMLESNRKRLLGQAFADYVSAADQRMFAERLSDLVGGCPAGSAWEMTLRTRKGKLFHALITAKSSAQSSGGMVAVRWLMHDISERRELEQQRLWLLRRLVSAHEEERSNLARELHDKMAQHLAALSLGLESLKIAGPSAAAFLTDVEKLQGIAGSIGREVHEIAAELRPSEIDSLGLSAALSNYVQEWSEKTGISVSMNCSGFQGRPPLPPDVRIAMYRIVQEALTNVQKHARAGHVNIMLDRCDDVLRAVVEDNGIGFDADKSLLPARSRRSLGLIGMRERAAAFCGELEIQSHPGAGTTVFARLPLDSIPARGTQP